MAEDAAIQQYEDTLLKYEGKALEGSSIDLKKKSEEAIAACKKKLHTNMDRLLAIADPANGEGFIDEVSRFTYKKHQFYTVRSTFGSESVLVVMETHVFSGQKYLL